MPGSSIWLIPPESSALYKALQPLIDTGIPSLFPNATTHHFIPHITITSNINKERYGHDPDAWLQALELGDSSRVRIDLESVEPGKPFFKKLTVRCARDPALLRLAATCRSEGVLNGDKETAKAWADKDYLPHLSLMYAELGSEEVEKQVHAVKTKLSKAREHLSDDAAGSLCCKGGVIVLVPTDKPISEWEPIANRDISQAEWHWSL